MGATYDAALLVLQILVGFGSLVALSHFLLITFSGLRGDGLVRRKPEQPLHFVFMVPCLNEELVIAATIERLLKHPDNATIYVIDDGSDDTTADIVRSYAEITPRVRLFRRELPNARQGKGEALNACYRQLVRTYTEAGIDPDQVIVCIMDADGLLDANALRVVEPAFGDERVGAAQIAVRIINRETFRGRLQDSDFFVFGNIIQRGRNALGSVGLGGNGQFTRLSALMSVGGRPWTECLTEDLDLGLQLIIKSWRLTYTSRTAVHQQGLVDLDKLVRQRTRWVQGIFQCWGRIPQVLRMEGRWYTKLDLCYHLLWPAMSCLVFPIAVAMSWALFSIHLIQDSSLAWSWLLAVLGAYLVAFGPTLMVAYFYRSVSRDISFWRATVLAHLMPLFQFVWLVAGWRSVGRHFSGRSGWAKTERVAVPSGDGQPIRRDRPATFP